MTAVTADQLLRFGAAVAVLVALGFLLIRLACGREMTRSLSWAFAPVVGAGACSLIEFVFRRPMFTVELLLLLVLFVHAYASENLDVSKRRLSQPVIPALVLVFAFAAAWVLSDSVTMVDRLPNGGTDGWAIWNSHARFLYRDGPHWAVDIKNSFHPDYPLLVPLMSARIWRYAGDSTDLSGLWAVLFGLAGAALLTVTVMESRSVVAGVIAGVVLLGTPMYLQAAAGQEADVPLAVFYLATIALLMQASQKEPDNSRIIALSGFTAGCAAWTKNEGILFLLATTLIMLAPI